jgi:putative tricarboxylic transport membrane protein
MIIFGIVGYLMKKFDYPPAPLILSFLLGPMFERSLGQSLIMGDDSPLIFFSRPISAVLVIAALSLLISPVILKVFKKQRPEIEGNGNL